MRGRKIFLAGAAVQMNEKERTKTQLSLCLCHQILTRFDNFSSSHSFATFPTQFSLSSKYDCYLATNLPEKVPTRNAGYDRSDGGEPTLVDLGNKNK